MSDVIGKTCPYCQTPIKPGELVVFCSACSIPHHQQCWNEGMGCTTFGCGGHPVGEPFNLNSRSNTVVVDIDINDSIARFCSNCGFERNDQAVYCSRGGKGFENISASEDILTPNFTTDSSQNDPGEINLTNARRSSYLVPALVFVGIVILIMVVVVPWLNNNGNTQEEEINYYGNTPGNISNEGLVAKQGDWIYYCNISEGRTIYKIHTDGTGRTKLNSDNSYDINVVGDWIYYGNFSDCFSIYKIRTDGSGRTKLNDDGSSFINVVGDWIYYSNSEDNYSL